jgi:hypothetical protein
MTRVSALVPQAAAHPQLKPMRKSACGELGGRTTRLPAGLQNAPVEARPKVRLCARSSLVCDSSAHLKRRALVASDLKELAPCRSYIARGLHVAYDDIDLAKGHSAKCGSLWHVSTS